MRKITENAVQAMSALKNFKSGNTRVSIEGAVAKMYLHNNLIATYNSDYDLLTINDCNYQTPTTKERLNGVLHQFRGNYKIFQKNRVWYIKTDFADAITIKPNTNMSV